MGVGASIPGQRTGVVIAPRDALFSYQAVRFGFGVIDAANAYDGANTNHEDELRPGTILARITSTKLWVPCKRTQANGAGSSTATLVVDDARAFKAGDTLQIGSTTGTISSIVYSTNTITLTATKSWGDNDVVYATNVAGAEIARGILNEFIKLKDEDGVARNKPFGQAVICGLVDPNVVLGDLAGIKAATNYLSHIQFADDSGLI